jgi:Fur family transcriptional regulator, ferric uptake regulator
MTQALQKFETYLQSTNSRVTSQKKEIAELIFKTKDHFEVEDFIEIVRKKHKTISRATLYRTIKQLLDAGLIQKIRTREGKIFYEQSSSQKQHAHIICNQCGELNELKDKKMDDVINSYCSEIDFKPEYQSIHIYGLCKKCK